MTLLPLSLIPLAIGVPMVVQAHANYIRYYESPPFPAPHNVLTAAQLRQFQPLPAVTGAIPVLVYHGINGSHDGVSVTRRQFAAQMEMLHAAGFRTVNIAQYNAFQHGGAAGLPTRPILITFDGGRLDSYRGADEILARAGFEATMFLVTGEITAKNPLYLDWTELRRMRRSGRWDIQPEAYQGDVKFTIDSRGDQAPFYAARRDLRSTGEETFSAYQRRVGDDLFTLAAQFKAQDIPVYSIAVPFGDYGQLQTGNDPRIVPFTLGLMKAQFGTVFLQDDGNPPFTTATMGGPQDRWEALSTTTPEEQYAWLSAHDPAPLASTPGLTATPLTNHHRN
jgi:hypothetical protein